VSGKAQRGGVIRSAIRVSALRPSIFKTKRLGRAASRIADGLPNGVTGIMCRSNRPTSALVDAQGDDQSGGEQQHAEEDRGLQAHQDLQESDRE
jgi:hypothetical protein